MEIIELGYIPIRFFCPVTGEVVVEWGNPNEKAASLLAVWHEFSAELHYMKDAELGKMWECLCREYSERQNRKLPDADDWGRWPMTVGHLENFLRSFPRPELVAFCLTEPARPAGFGSYLCLVLDLSVGTSIMHAECAT